MYLLYDYNRDSSYRSPWTNTYEPPLDDGILPSDTLRTMERSANDVFQSYREMYYEGGASPSASGSSTAPERRLAAAYSSRRRWTRSAR